MKALLSFSIAILAVVMMNVSALANHNKHHHKKHTMPARSNKGGKVRGKERAEEVQEMNKKADENRGFTTAPGLNKEASKPAEKTPDTN